MLDRPISPKTIALIVAAGRGNRFGGNLPKQYAPLGAGTVLSHAVSAFVDHPSIDAVQVVIHADDQALYDSAILPLGASKLRDSVPGGATRQASVKAGLEVLAPVAPEVVLIHDAARPFLSRALISEAIAAARHHGAAVPGSAVTDTVTQIAEGRLSAPLSREALRAIQTPQAFRFPLILDAHRSLADQAFTDDGTLALAAGHAVHVFEGEAGNIKITTVSDLENAEKSLGQSVPQRTLISRTGTGYDVHAFGPGDHVWLCGVKISHPQGFIAHSDGDVALHALTDALFAALADGDIGRHFPPTEARWKGAASDQFLAFAVERLRTRGGIIDLLDVTIICEAPKITPHAEAMRARIADIAGVQISAVSVKATTTERLGFTGRKEGIAAMGTATIRLPEGR